MPGRNCFLSLEDVENRILEACARVPKPAVISISAGVAANLIVHNLFPKIGHDAFLIDMGSVWDPYCGVRSRSYHHKLDIEQPPATELEDGANATRIQKVSAHDAVLKEAASRESQNGRISMATMDWLYNCDEITTTSRPSKKHDPAKEAADMLLATYWE